MREYVKLPNLITSGSLAAGFLAILLTFQDNLPLIFQDNLLLAAGLVALAAVFDILDGPMARRVGTEGVFGTNLDSLADLVSFGAAPALALYWGSLYKLPIFGVAACLVFLLCGAWRLARFPICKNSLYFVGCPIPAAGVLVALLAVLRPHPLLALLVALILSVLMVSTHPFPTLSGLRNREELSQEVEEYRKRANA